MIITSVENKLIKEAIKLKQKKYRDEQNMFIVEGIKMVSEIPQDWNVDKLFISERIAKSYSDIAKKFDNDRVFVVSDNVLNKLSDTENPQGIVALCEKKIYNVEALYSKEKLNIILLEEIQDPGNLGTIIRTADAMNMDGVIITKNSVDLYNNKTIRATMSSIFHIPIITDVDIYNVIDCMKKNDIKIFATSLNTDKYILDVVFNNKNCFVIGNEANGITDFVKNSADILFKIPMLGQAESLNASIAAGIVMYEASKKKVKDD